MPTRIARGSGARLTVDLEDSAGEPLEEAEVEITVTSSAGTELVTAEDATEDALGIYMFDLDAVHAVEIDQLTATWSHSAGEATTRHDVVGCHFHTIKSLRAFEPLNDDERYAAADLLPIRDLAAYALEDACKVAFCERFASVQAVADGGDVLLPKVGVKRVLWVTADGEDVDLADVSLGEGGALVNSFSADQQIEVGFVHALTESPPDRVARAAQLVCREIAFSEESGVPDRATSLAADGGTFSLVTAGVGGAAFDLPEVNAVVKQYRAYGPISRA